MISGFRLLRTGWIATSQPAHGRGGGSAADSVPEVARISKTHAAKKGPTGRILPRTRIPTPPTPRYATADSQLARRLTAAVRRCPPAAWSSERPAGRRASRACRPPKSRAAHERRGTADSLVGG